MTIRTRASSSGSVASSRRPSAFSAVADRSRGARPDLVHDASRDHLVGASLDPTQQLRRRDVEAENEGWSPHVRRPEAIGDGRERASLLGELECADDAAAVADVHGSRGGRIELAKPCVGSSGVGVVETLEADSARRVGRRRDSQVGERGAQIQPRSSSDDSGAVRLDEGVDRRVCEVGVFGDRHRLREVADGHEAGRDGWLVREQRQPSVDLERVGGHDLRTEAAGERLCDHGLARGGRAEDRDDLVQSGQVLWGTPAHHPLRA